MSKKILIRLIILLLLFVAIIFLMFNDNGILKYVKTKAEVNNLETQIKKYDDSLAVVSKQIDSLKNNKFMIEKVAREKYRMKKKNEKVLKVEEN
ncbi:septum formation initiator family protein [Melioribacteraceae bacterium 4301-Me]|uniref:FtsB family cell division protein n=1 Tax=Pyranulibacter aquaticus TaxID=3163344 RepID=UPI0035997954